MFQTKEQDKTPEEELSDVEIDNLPKKEFRVMIVKMIKKLGRRGVSLVVQWLRLCPPNAGDPDSFPGQGTRPHMPQLSVRMPQLKMLHAATKDPTCPKDPTCRDEDLACGNEGSTCCN